MTVVSTDSTGSAARQSLIVTVTSSPNLVYTPLEAIGATGSLLATDPATVLWLALPGTAVISGKTVYFTNGMQQLLYSVTLN